MQDSKTIFGQQIQLTWNHFSFRNCSFRQLLCVIDGFTKYCWVKPLKDKKGKTVLSAFIKIVNKSYCQSNKLWVDQGK